MKTKVIALFKRKGYTVVVLRSQNLTTGSFEFYSRFLTEGNVVEMVQYCDPRSFDPGRIKTTLRIFFQVVIPVYKHVLLSGGGNTP